MPLPTYATHALRGRGGETPGQGVSARTHTIGRVCVCSSALAQVGHDSDGNDLRLCATRARRRGVPCAPAWLSAPP